MGKRYFFFFGCRIVSIIVIEIYIFFIIVCNIIVGNELYIYVFISRLVYVYKEIY